MEKTFNVEALLDEDAALIEHCFIQTNGLNKQLEPEFDSEALQCFQKMGLFCIV